ncbi:DNA replication pre-initiation complex subunit Cdc45 [Gilbertella persicaria]|uniref:DNA replication pre-initiation complex subunit Cdc45 n=1 Tax=Gilbertella persicaria TaxID=101096 RepID=UPI0022208C64|nr:DNA replication pre-initiation complex subunit Cdc45 [Gilbertella persicaria]KAI8092402.1 DNA replication pre-initiation complex subunit Cdc45 [Gilbertella persicaria]
MVRITNTLYHEAYEYIKQDSVEGNCIIFVAPDVDAICAVRLFQAVLKSDIIPHKIVPVSGHQDLVDANIKLIQKDQELRSIVMINCGGMESISSLFTTPEGTKIYIIDSHRPLLLENLSSDNDHICVFDDEGENHRVNDVLSAYEELTNTEDDDEEDSEDSDSDRPRQRRKLDTLDQGMSIHALRNKKRQQNKLIQDYYEAGVYHANSVSGVMYELAHQLGKSTNELLWLGIVGVTAQYLFEKIDTVRYAEKLELFKDDRARLNIDRTEDGNMQQLTNIVIRAEDEYRFMLFRHWSLYESMYHSGYVSSKLGIWKDAGKKRLNNMFAKMGFSLQQCQQIYTHMDMDLKQTLKNKIEVVAPLYGLTDICFPSFTRGYGYACCLSASDVVYALSTLIETSPEAATRLGFSTKEKEEEEESDMKEQTTTVDGLGCQRRQWWMHNFYAAYDALGSPSPEPLMRGLRLCMKTQKAIVRQGTDIIDKRMVKLLRTFRFVNIRHGQDLSLFQHPSTLTKLGLFLTDAYREHGRRNLPLVLTSLDEENNSCLVVALSGAPTFGEVRKNPFYLAFSDAAEKTKARISFDSFDHTVVQIHDADIEHFIESLSYYNK